MSETTETTHEHIDGAGSKGAISDPTPADRTSDATGGAISDDTPGDHTSEAAEGRASNAPPDDGLNTTKGTDDEQDTFPRDYVEKLRDESAKYRQRAQRADDLAKRLHTTLVEATGRLHDASDLEFDETHLDDPEALTAAVDALLTRKPHLASRKPTGSIGQGVSVPGGTVDLAGILRSRA